MASSSSSSSPSKTVTLVSSDGLNVVVDERAVAMSSVLLNNLTEGDDWADKSVTSSTVLINVTSKYLDKAMQYCIKHAAAAATATAADKKAAEEELKKWDEEYINVSAEDLFHILMVANFLDIQGLLELAAQQAANLMKGKKVEDIRDMFGITNDYTAEEEEKLHERNAWAFL